MNTSTVDQQAAKAAASVKSNTTFTRTWAETTLAFVKHLREVNQDPEIKLTLMRLQEHCQDAVIKLLEAENLIKELTQANKI